MQQARQSGIYCYMFFSKMHANGNDYVFIKDYDCTDAALKNAAVKLSDRRKGIGGDGLIIVKKIDDYTIKMRIFNADGSEGATCGNGMRCAAYFAKKYLGVTADEITVSAKAADYKVKLFEQGGKIFAEADFPVPKEFLSRDKLQRALAAERERIFAVNAGNEHLVVVGAARSARDYALSAKSIGLFKDGVNVETVTADGNSANAVIYERGSGYTSACGSGAVAIAFVARQLGAGDVIRVNTAGGTSTVTFSADKATLKSEIAEAFDGEFYENALSGESGV